MLRTYGDASRRRIGTGAFINESAQFNRVEGIGAFGAPEHDHAWHPVEPAGTRLIGEWRCQLCGAVWSM